MTTAAALHGLSPAKMARCTLLWSMAWLGGLGCAPESVGVPVERGGPQSLSADELRRDAWRWARAAPGARGAYLQRRLSDMRWAEGPAPGGVAGAWCRRRGEGAGGAAIWWSAPDPAADPDAEGLQWAALIAFAKAIPDQPRPRPLWICAAPSPIPPAQAAAALSGAGLEPVAFIGPLRGGPVEARGAFGAAGQRYAERAPAPWVDLAEADAQGLVLALRALSAPWAASAPARD